MATVKGQNLRVMFDSGDPETPNPCVAASTNCVLHLSAQIEEDTSKDTVDDWIQNTVVGLAWDVSVDALVVEPEQSSSGIGVNDLTIGLVYDLIFTRTTGTQNREQEEGAVSYKGKAVLNDLNIIASNEDISTYTAKFTGIADLQEVDSQ